MADTINSMTLYVAGGGGKDFYPWNLVLEEGFSRLYRGELTVLSEKKHDMPELAGLLDKGISLSLSQRVGTGDALRTRYLHGIVTEARCAGVFSDGKKKDCYSYIFTIEPELARLKFTRLTAPYYRVTPPDIFESILRKYRIEARMEQQYISRTQYGKTLLFDQSDMSDFDFIRGIAGLYGSSFTFVHPKTGASALGSEGLYFSDGNKFPRTDVVYSDKREEPDTVKFDFLGTAEAQSVWKMDRWVMSRSIGFDGFKLSAPYPDANYGSDQWKWGKTGEGDRYVNQRRLFHGYEREAEKGEVDKDVARILEVRRLTVEQDKVRWTAGAGNLALRPGLILELGHFYGKKDRDVFIALVTAITLRHRALWPVDFAAAVEGSGGEITEVEGSCVNWGKDAEKRFCPSYGV
ncbi:MAG: phage late control D family protein [Treponema sp.]|jgi:uncharacterized protein involved in type VI secretion and phage assembly|nr:phage late control D family protein [Treponema sp.]